MNMSLESKYEMLFKFMNQTRSKYMGLDLTYEYEVLPSGELEVDIYIEGKFPLPIRSKEMFSQMFTQFMFKDSKYFGLSNASTIKLIKFNNIVLNGVELLENISLTSEFTEDLKIVDSKLKEYYSIAFEISNTPQGSILLELTNNDIKTWLDWEGLHMDDDLIMYTLEIKDSSKLSLNGNIFNRNTILDFLSSVDLGELNYPLNRPHRSELEPNNIFQALANEVYSQSVEGGGESLGKFFDALIKNGMSYNNVFMENIGVLSVVILGEYDGMVNDNVHNHNTQSQAEALSIFVGWLETNKGKYRL